jgi:HD superfamily phosphohydrolase
VSGNLFLSKKDEPIQRIRCPVHGFIRFSDNERKFIDHPLFQRLRNIRQLALACYVYPGALHSRFEHSLGVMELATRAFDSLCRTYEDVYNGPRNLDRVICYTWERERGGPSGEFEEAASAVV